MHLFRFFCVQLSKKVNKSNSSDIQNKVSGTIAILITLLPLVIILWLFEDFIEVEWLWTGCLLYFALGSFGLTRMSMKIAKALTANKTYDAKQFISPLVLRETEKLSTLGLCKTTIEMQLIQTIQQCFVVVFYFFIIGPLAALSFRLLLEMHYSWNIKQKRNIPFGQLVHWLVQVLQWIPTRLFVFILLLGTIGQNFVLYWQLIIKHFFKLNNNIAILSLALAIEKKLGGVAVYDNDKLRRESFNDKAREPEPVDIIAATKRVNQVLYFSLLSIILTNLLWMMVNIQA